ncbi:rRNA pseudouridine synthase [Malaciobacter canalis]|jgi:23S rRNA pseudouridine2605 synthase|uniref:Pseudouridine synthase n=2 Tax=Malaciobacter TaxID=2321114 RepID=A0AB36ZVG1_9BACT|nr:MULTISPECIES: pseudouridine synthase [Malaciobacter]PHO09527.1 rRNA pseudouridine synthase [Malaciobacter canalis]PPK61372.1 23S rRNA pseudouridine2605 synthase [Malaciobacter marinus]QEE31590.1 23S rRNA pseudouridine 2605 synthase [Malaciobacter canalis]SKB45440.1 23S rRNA pseudouridine2605 synthase [Malaciobacter marinus]
MAKEKNITKQSEDLVRLNKFLSHNSTYSRREADKIIEEGRVSIDGKVVTNLATKVSENNLVKIDKKVIKADKNRMYTVIVYNKPKGELVTKSDPQGRKTIYDTLGKKYKHFLPIGRLDYASEGVILLSDSVDVVNKLMHSNLERIYKLKVDGEVDHKVEKAMLEGLELDDASEGAHEKSKIKSMTFAPFVAYQILSANNNFSKLKVAISEGKNRELRRFFGHFGLNVMDLKRLEFGGISLNNLPTGKSRYLNKEEYRNLRKYLNSDDD